MTMSNSNTTQQNTPGDCAANSCPAQTTNTSPRSHGGNGGKSVLENASLNTPDAIAGRTLFKEILMEAFGMGVVDEDDVARFFARYELAEL